MSEAGTTSPAAKAKAPPAEIDLDDFAVLVARMNRLLIGFTSLPPFKNSKIGLVEWAALSFLLEHDGIGNKQLAKGLGVTGQRANQISTALLKSKLITVKSSDADNRKNVIEITEAGKKQISTVNGQLRPLLATTLKNKERVLGAAARQMRIIMRVLQPEKPLIGKVAAQS